MGCRARKRVCSSGNKRCRSWLPSQESCLHLNLYLFIYVLGKVDVADLIQWISDIDFADWHQQPSLVDGQIRPAMMTDLSWHGFGYQTDSVVSQVMFSHFTGCASFLRMLSVVMPGHSIEPHTDSQASYWICRVHVPLISNTQSDFIIGGLVYNLIPGMAYKVNTEAVHSVSNNGEIPRIHF